MTVGWAQSATVEVSTWPAGRGARPLAASPDRSAQNVIRGHAFIQNLRRGHYELGTHARHRLEVAAAFAELAGAV